MLLCIDSVRLFWSEQKVPLLCTRIQLFSISNWRRSHLGNIIRASLSRYSTGKKTQWNLHNRQSLRRVGLYSIWMFNSDGDDDGKSAFRANTSEYYRNWRRFDNEKLNVYFRNIFKWPFRRYLRAKHISRNRIMMGCIFFGVKNRWMFWEFIYRAGNRPTRIICFKFPPFRCASTISSEKALKGI